MVLNTESSFWSPKQTTFLFQSVCFLTIKQTSQCSRVDKFTFFLFLNSYLSKLILFFWLSGLSLIIFLLSLFGCSFLFPVFLVAITRAMNLAMSLSRALYPNLMLFDVTWNLYLCLSFHCGRKIYHKLYCKQFLKCNIIMLTLEALLTSRPSGI